ncbi:MAG TPA: hypothetical protein VGK81_12790 [Anaerolineae bacterium]
MSAELPGTWRYTDQPVNEPPTSGATAGAARRTLLRHTGAAPAPLDTSTSSRSTVLGR